MHDEPTTETSSSFSIHTLGCKANSSDSDALNAQFLSRGWRAVPPGESPSVIVINTCSVTDSADRQSAKLAARLKRLHPNSRLVVTGCAAEANPDQFRNKPGIDWIVGNRDRHRISEWADASRRVPTSPVSPAKLLGDTRGYDTLTSRHPMDREWPEPELFPIAHVDERAHTRLFLKIQEGCDSFCTYCIIPYGRGPSRSLRPDELIDHVRALVDRGIREIVLTGTNLGDYGLEHVSNRDQHKKEHGASGLLLLLRRIVRETGMERVRLSSLDPTELGTELRAFVASESRVCAHFHVSLQSPLTAILKRMKRHYTTDTVRSCLEELSKCRGPNGAAWVGMDVITGFPGESDEDFLESKSILESAPWTRLHVFPYSERKGTPATKLPGAVPQSIRKERARILQKLSFDRLREHLQPYERSRLKDVLWEGPTRGPDGTHHWIGGTTSDYLRVIQPWANEVQWNGRGTISECLVHSLGMDPVTSEGVLIAQATNH